MALWPQAAPPKPQYLGPGAQIGTPTPPALGGGVMPGGGASSMSPFQTALNTYMAAAGPQTLNLQQRSGLLQSNMGLALQKGEADKGGMQANYDMQLGDINASIGKNAIDQEAALRLLPYYDQLSDIQRKLVDQQLTAYGLNEQQAQTQAGAQRRAAQSSAITRGAMFTSGTQATRSDIENSLQQQLGIIGTNKASAQLQGQQQQLSIQEQRAQAQDREKQLQIEATNLNMKPAQLQRALQSGLQSLGLSTMMSVNDLMDGVLQNNFQAMAIYNQAIQNAQLVAGKLGGQIIATGGR